MQAIYVCKGGKVRKVTERKMGNKHLLEAYKAKHGNAGREKSDGKKAMQYAFIRSMGSYIKVRRKWAKKGEKARKGTERKMGNMHLLKYWAS
jgi:hypothetical protein